MRSSTSTRAFIVVLASAAFFWTLALSVSPQLHKRVHPDANRRDHSCGVTLIASGNYNHSQAAPLLTAPAPASQFCHIPELNSTWVQALFLRAHIFAHAPPAQS